MFGIPTFDPWIGPEYKKVPLKLLVLGESRYDEEFTDRRVIQTQISRGFPGGQRRTFTNFERAVLGQEHSEAERQGFWRRVIFYNYNLSIFPGKPRVRVEYKRRENPRNSMILQRMLTEFKPTHAIVWGKTNWDSIDTGPNWEDGAIPGSGVATVDSHAILFMFVRHPSSGFSSEYWHPVLMQFLAVRL